MNPQFHGGFYKLTFWFKTWKLGVSACFVYYFIVLFSFSNNYSRYTALKVGVLDDVYCVVNFFPVK